MRRKKETYVKYRGKVSRGLFSSKTELVEPRFLSGILIKYEEDLELYTKIEMLWVFHQKKLTHIRTPKVTVSISAHIIFLYKSKLLNQ
tara:strand:+ start:4518 stop:4781 length:264 start_codon:yes stop_codon:yes gene_type:complete